MASLKNIFGKFGKGKKKSLSKNPNEKGTDPVVVLSAGLVSALVVIILLIVFIIYPTVTSILSTRELISQNQNLLERLNDKNTKVTEADKKYKAQEQNFGRLQYSFPDEERHIENIKLIERIAADTTASGANFILSQISVPQIPPFQEQTKTARAYNRSIMSISINFKADYTGAQIFLENLKKNLRNFTIVQLVFSSSGQNSGSMLEVSTRIESIYYSAF